MKLELQATPEEVMRGVEALESFGEARGIPAKILFGLTLALEECASNVVNHGLRRDAGKTFQVTFSQADGTMVIELRDAGPPFDPTLAPPGDGIAGDDDAPGGWGIFLVRKYTDEMVYAREAGENVLRLIKRLPEPV